MEMPWFMWKGRRSLDLGVTVGEYPPVTRVGLRAERVPLPGRSGAVTLSAAPVYDPVTLTLTVLLMPGTLPETALAWLSGEGELILGNEPRRSRRAAMIRPLALRDLPGGWYSGEARFECEPLKGAVPPEGDIRLTAADWEDPDWPGVCNPGDVTARPILRAEGTGLITLAWPAGGDGAPPTLTVDLRDTAHTGFRFDAETLRVTDPDGRESLSALARLENGEAEAFGLRPGLTRLVPSATEGGVTALTITPRWRWL